MKILVLLTLCVLCISFRSVHGKNLTLTLFKNFCPRGIKCLNSTSFSLCQNTDNFFAVGKQIFTCPRGKKCDEHNPNPCLTQEMKNELKNNKKINLHINYIDQRKAPKTNETHQRINVILDINKCKPPTKNGTVTRKPETSTSMPSSTVVTSTEQLDPFTESAEDKSTTTYAPNDKSAETESTETTYKPDESDTNVGGKDLRDKSSKTKTYPVPIDESASSESSEDEATQIPTTESSVATNTIDVPPTELVEEEAPNVSASESVEEEPNASTPESVEEETPYVSSVESVEEVEAPEFPRDESVEEESALNKPRRTRTEVPRGESVEDETTFNVPVHKPRRTKTKVPRGESVEDETTFNVPVHKPRRTKTKVPRGESVEEESALNVPVDKPRRTKTKVPRGESVEEESALNVPVDKPRRTKTKVPRAESVEEESALNVPVDKPRRTKTKVPRAESVEEESALNVPVHKPRRTKTKVPRGESVEEESALNVSVDKPRRTKIKSKPLYVSSTTPRTTPKQSKKKKNEDRGFYVQFIRQGRKRNHIEYATFVDLDYGGLAHYIPAFLQRYSEIRIHSEGLKVVNKTWFGNFKSNGIYGIKFEGVLENVRPGTFKGLDDLVWVKLNGHLLRRIESHVFTGLKIREIELQGNIINYLAPNAFDNMRYLEKIDLTNNNLKEYDPRWFHNDHKLSEVIFSKNYLQKIPAFAFKNVDLFRRKINLYFDQNLIEKIHRNVYFKTSKDAKHFKHQKGSVYTFFLNSNKLHCVPEIVMKRTKHLSLEDNPLSCGCIRRIKIEGDKRHNDSTTSMRLSKKSVKTCLL